MSQCCYNKYIRNYISIVKRNQRDSYCFVLIVSLSVKWIFKLMNVWKISNFIALLRILCYKMQKNINGVFLSICFSSCKYIGEITYCRTRSNLFILLLIKIFVLIAYIFAEVSFRKLIVRLFNISLFNNNNMNIPCHIL